MSTSTRSLASLDVSLPGPAEWTLPLASLFAASEKLLDLAAVLSAVLFADVLYRALDPARAAACAPSTVFLCAAGFALLFVFLLDRYGGYRPCLSLLAIRETERILRVTLQAFLLALLAAYFCAVPVSRLAFSLALVTVPLFLTLEKWEMHKLLRILRGKGFGTRRAVILGTGPAARRIYSALVRSPKFGVDPVAFVDDDPQAGTTEIYEPSYRGKHSARVMPGPLCPELFRQLNASVLVIADPAANRESMLLTNPNMAAGVSIYFAPADFLEPGYWVDYAELDGIVLAHLSRGTNRILFDLGKRMLDMFVAALMLLPLAVIAPVIAILVKSTSPGPVLFRQQRAGKAGRRFTMFKFRTMFQDAPHYETSPGAGDDPRVTPVGRFLRRTSLDELPQLMNVLLGQMSLVGPRPEMPFIVEQYTPLQRQRLLVKPGITGLWQIGPTRAFPIHENMEYDLYYFRVNIVYIQVPCLRERVEDIPPLAQHLVRSIARNCGRQEMCISGSAMSALKRYSWPGNIRELRNVLERASLVAGRDIVTPEHLHFQSALAPELSRQGGLSGTLKQMERAYIHHVLHDEGGSIERAARRLGIPRSSLYNKMKRFEIPHGTGRM
jgi:exopolysaccharide biosynthesis polyprenyl glycosylphosphotransferase